MTDLADELLGRPLSKAEKPYRESERRGHPPLNEQIENALNALPRFTGVIGGVIAFTILGQPCSKANSRNIVTMNRGKENQRTAVVKSKDALAYERAALLQIPPAARQRLEGPVAVTLRLFYASELPDLDESIVLDVLQDRYAKGSIPTKGSRVLVQAGVYRNDRQVREKHVFHGIDKANPRAEIEVRALTPQQSPLL